MITVSSIICSIDASDSTDVITIAGVTTTVSSITFSIDY